MEDQQLIEICNKIYNKHKKALDLIYANRTDGRSRIKESIIDTLIELDEEGTVIYNQESGNLFFRTPEMDKLLPLLDKAESSWGTNSVYTYWFSIQDDKFYAAFELGGDNVPEHSMTVMNTIIDALKPNDKKRNDFKYKRLFRTKWYDLSKEENIEESVSIAVRDAIHEIKVMEKNLNII